MYFNNTQKRPKNSPKAAEMRKIFLKYFKKND